MTGTRAMQLSENGLALRAADIGMRSAHTVRATVRAAQVFEHSHRAIHKDIVSGRFALPVQIVPAPMLSHSSRRVLFLSRFRSINPSTGA